MGKIKRIERNNKQKLKKGILEDSENLRSNENDNDSYDSFFETREEAEAFKKLKEICEKVYKEQEEGKRKKKNITFQENKQKKDDSKKLPINKEKQKRISRRF